MRITAAAPVIEEISDRERAELFLVVARIKTDLGVPFTGVLILTARHTSVYKYTITLNLAR